MNAWLILLASALSGGFEEDFEKDFTGATMRLDFFHSGTSEEEHVDWLEAQLELIKQVGVENYLAQQIRD